MNFQTLTIPVPVAPLCHDGMMSNGNFASVSCSVMQSLCISLKNFGGSLGKPFFGSRSNFGSSYVCSRISGTYLSLRNGGGLVRIRSEELEGGGEEDAYYMRRCVDLARQAIGWTSPNPMVGCVIVKDDKIVGKGFHPKAGQPHGEVFALRDAGELAKNATAYVSLEPCNHHGRTPPCTEALIKANVKKVVVGMVDPNPIVSSKGIDRLREAGIEVVVGVEEELCRKLNEAFIHKMLFGRPFVTIRYSMSINGVALDQLEEGAMKCGGYYSKLLEEYDAVIHAPVTTQEFSIAASQEPNARQPLNIIVAKNAESPLQIVNLPTKAIVFSNKEVTSNPQVGIETVVMDKLSLDAILEYCSKQGLNNVLVDLRGNFDDLEKVLEEGLKMDLLQKIMVEVLPFWAHGKGSVSSSMMTSLIERKRLKVLSPKTCGNSVLLEGYF